MRLVVIVGFAVSLTGCGPRPTATADGVGPPSPSLHTEPPTPTPLPTSPIPITAGTVTLGEADGQRTIHVATGQHIDVALRAQTSYSWSAPLSGDEHIVATTSSETGGGGSASGSFTAAGIGTTTVSATNDPNCGRSVPRCMLPSALWQVTVIVTA